MGVYQKLTFTYFNLNAPVLNESAGGILYHSAPNDAFGNIGQLDTMVPIVSTAYTSSKITSFSIDSSSYGCHLQAAQGEVVPAEARTITIKGYPIGWQGPKIRGMPSIFGPKAPADGIEPAPLRLP